MSIVIVGGNDKMVYQYKNLCKEHNCRIKVFTQMTGTFRNKIGSPDLMVLFTNTISHKMVRSALCETKGTRTVIERCHTSSLTALKGILDTHAPKC